MLSNQQVTGSYNYAIPGHGRNTIAVNDAAGTPWYQTGGNQWRNSKTGALSKDVPSMIPTAGGGAAAPAASGNPPYFDYVVPGHGNKTQAIKDTAGDTWYKTQGNQWRNVRTRATQANLPTWQTAAPAPAPTPVAEPAPATPVAPQPAPDTFRSIRDFTAKGQDPFDINGAYDDSLYNFQKDQGIKAIRAALSADGGLGSGAEGEVIGNYLGQIGAQEAQRRQDMMEAARTRAAQAAGGDQSQYYSNLNTDNALKLTKSNSTWGRIMDVLDRLFAQSPASAAFSATQNSASGLQQLGDMLAQLEVAQGQPGTTISTPGYQTPTAAPNYGSAAASYSNATDWTKLLGSLLPLVAG